MRKTCAQCGGPFLVSPAAARSYQTCSPTCSTALRSVQRMGRPLPRKRRACAAPERQSERAPAPTPAERPDLQFLAHGGLLVSCVRCSGLRGRWRVSEMPPPGLCWLCLMRRNAGLEPGMPLG